MKIDPIEKIHSVETERVNLTLQDLSPQVEQPPIRGSTLPQVFNQDKLEPYSSANMTSQPAKIEAKTRFFWDKFPALLSPFKTSPPPSSVSTVDNKSDEAAPIEALSLIPALDPPHTISPELAATPLPFPSQKKGVKLLQSEIAEGLAQMSDHSFEQIMFILHRAQLEFEKENAQVAEKIYAKDKTLKALSEKDFLEIQEVLKKDEKVAAFFKKTYSIAQAAGFICAMATVALTCGLVPPVGAFIGAAAGATLAGFFTTATSFLGTFGPFVTAGFIGYTGGSKASSKRKLDVSQAQHAKFSHKHEHCRQSIEDSMKNLMFIAETDQTNKEHLIQLLKDFQRMWKAISAK